MPSPAVCNKITDPVERKKCLQYKGKYAQQNQGNPKAPTKAPPRGDY